ncbi:DNA polymerase IV [Streptomyces sp. NBC_01218]|uniref:DNA polymerase IV n=1 Tax=Streptomyces sp. NBC_01218 TaxID=2903780 RepID=UPI002E10EABB|nr:DNA polymerase IV [Streptomyces sp. NBC_01218]
MRSAPTILHLDMDAFYASAEQAAKPSLRGKPVVVGGVGPRGVVATASYEARRFGVHSAMPTAQARRLAPNAAYLMPRFSLYRAVSEQVMELLRGLSPLVEPLSLDEAFVDLEAGGTADDSASARATGERLREAISTVTGLRGSVGLAGSKMLAKIASEEAKPDGLVLIEPGTERELLAPMSVRTLPGVGPATGDHLRRAGMSTVSDLVEAGEDELVRLVGRAHGASLYRMALGRDDRPVVAERDAKSVSVEDTFEVDLHDRDRVRAEVERLANRCVERLRKAGRSGRTVVLKVRRYDFSTLTRSETLRGPTDDPGVVRVAAARLLEGVDTTGGVRLLGVGVTGLADYTQEDLFAQAAEAEAERAALPVSGTLPGTEAAPVAEAAGSAGTGPREPLEEPVEGADRPAAPPPDARADEAAERAARRWPAGHDVRHGTYGHGWVQGSGVGRVTVRFERPGDPPGRVRTFRVDDPDLHPADPLPLVAGPVDYSSWPASLPKSLSGPGSVTEEESSP